MRRRLSKARPFRSGFCFRRTEDGGRRTERCKSRLLSVLCPLSSIVRDLPYSPASLSVESADTATMLQGLRLVTGSLERSGWHDYYVMGTARRACGKRFLHLAWPAWGRHSTTRP